jgi:DNA-binding CsgD family transcriptional regulator
MDRLSARDLERALRFVHEASAETGPEPFPAHVLEALRALVGCEWASFCELDRARKEVIALVESPVPDLIASEDEELDTFWRIVEEHPLCHAHRKGRFDALKLSDFHAPRELHRTELYADWFRPHGVEYELELGIPSPLQHTKTFLLNDARRDFSERDRTLMNVLQPHFVQLYRAAEIRCFADRARAIVDDGRDLADRGLLIADARGGIEVASPLARRLLDDYGAQRLLTEWLAEQRAAVRAGRAPAALNIDGPAGTLIVELDRRGAAEVVLLEERTAPAALSTREHEVLALVADGLRNAEIAEALWVSPATVRKHLENIYEKLGVHTRTAAVAQLRGSG